MVTMRTQRLGTCQPDKPRCSIGQRPTNAGTRTWFLVDQSSPLSQTPFLCWQQSRRHWPLSLYDHRTWNHPWNQVDLPARTAWTLTTAVLWGRIKVGQVGRPVEHLPQTRLSDCRISVWSAFRKTENRICTTLAIQRQHCLQHHVSMDTVEGVTEIQF